MLLRDRESEAIKACIGKYIDAEEQSTENGTLGNSRGNMSGCRRVIANGDSLRATRKIGFNPTKD